MISRKRHAKPVNVDLLVVQLTREGMAGRTDRIKSVVAEQSRALASGQRDALIGKLAHTAGIFAALCDPDVVDVERILTQLSDPHLAIALLQATSQPGKA